MNELLIPAASALWLGILTAISPCPLATNIVAISYIGRRVARPRLVLLSGLLYTIGRTLTYTAIAMLLVSSLLSAQMKNYGGACYGGELSLPITGDSRVLPCGIYARWEQNPSAAE